MAQQQSDVVIAYANQIALWTQQLKNIRDAIAAVTTVNTNNPLGAQWNKLNTTALNNDQTIGTADTPGTPVLTNPIDPRQYLALQKVAKASDYANGLQLIVDFTSFMAGSALTANAARPANIDALAQ